MYKVTDFLITNVRLSNNICVTINSMRSVFNT